MTQTLIPHIDLTPLLDNGPTRDETVAAIVEAASHSGFMTVGVAPQQLHLPDDIHARLLRFFELEARGRQRLARHKFEPGNRNVYRGYFPPQDEDPTWKEGIDLGPDVAHPERADAASGDPLREPTPQPLESALPGWSADVAGYYRGMERLGRVIAEALAEGLGMPRKQLLEPFDAGNSTLRLIHYPRRTPDALASMPAIDGEGDARRWLVGVPHFDNGFITLLWQDRVGGLQVRTPDGNWEEVVPRDNALVVNFGRLLSDWSDGRIQATEHRIVGGTRSRHSIPFFFEPAVDAHIQTLEGVDGDGYVYGDRLWARMLEFVEFQGLERTPTAPT
ncbi:2OG-Fe(II) oxygenase family protein [Kushneria indalinina]|uniref:Isopenicillin N synthase-like dioxygenase n=1 Tax=Kushneria indalinina DSM 14324 TaxID=1122140 RepID=A0A3D9DX09_9GAMM|nr:2OG-Fe(II) oxygenase family protein [Kushneria indalinina]REC95308.1 isopenicillin N synthase-like dioxygenase [Kushneria indalinina DSM 14324]